MRAQLKWYDDNANSSPWIDALAELRQRAMLDRDDYLCEMVARTVIEVGATGNRKPRKIAEVAVALIGLR